MRDKGREVKVTEQVALTRAYRLGDLVRLLGLLAQLLHLRHEDLVAAIGVSIAGPCTEHMGRVVLHQAPKVLGKHLHAV